MKKIKLPESQIQEVLYELINRLSIDRRSMMLASNVNNLTARISELRNMGVAIVSNKVVSINKYGREIVCVNYSLKNKVHAISIYNNLTSQ